MGTFTKLMVRLAYDLVLAQNNIATVQKAKEENHSNQSHSPLYHEDDMNVSHDPSHINNDAYESSMDLDSDAHSSSSSISISFVMDTEEQQMQGQVHYCTKRV